MKYFFISCCLFLSSGFQQKLFSQDYSDKQNMPVTTSREPFYPKGEKMLYQQVMYSIKYSEESKKKFIEGSVTMSFDVLPDSSVANVKIISDLGYGIGEEVKKLLQELKFAPAIQMGIPVRMNLMMDFPVKAH